MAEALLRRLNGETTPMTLTLQHASRRVDHRRCAAPLRVPRIRPEYRLKQPNVPGPGLSNAKPQGRYDKLIKRWAAIQKS